MRFGNYLKSYVGRIVVFTLFAVFLYYFVQVQTNNTYSSIFITGLMAMLYIIQIIFDYIKKKQYYSECDCMLQSMDQKTLADQVLPEANFFEAEKMQEIICIMEKYMNDEIQKYKLISKEYREYIELWIHEVKTPIASSKLILENHPTENSISLEEELEKIDNYVEQALYYARSNSVEKDYIIKGMKLSEVVNPVLRKLRRGFINYKVQLSIENLDEEVFTDEKWIQFVLEQIFSNALKYTSENPKLELSSFRTDNRVVLKICDNGIGIRKSDLPRVFEKGFTGENGRQYKKATGMGLYLVKKLCDKLNHGVSIESETNKGTTIQIYFPTSETEFLRQ